MLSYEREGECLVHVVNWYQHRLESFEKLRSTRAEGCSNSKSTNFWFVREYCMDGDDASCDGGGRRSRHPTCACAFCGGRGVCLLTCDGRGFCYLVYPTHLICASFSSSRGQGVLKVQYLAPLPNCHHTPFQPGRYLLCKTVQSHPDMRLSVPLHHKSSENHH